MMVLVWFGDIYLRKKLNLTPIIFQTKINSRWINTFKYDRQNNKASSIYNIECVHDLEIEENFLNRTQKALTIRETIGLH